MPSELERAVERAQEASEPEHKDLDKKHPYAYGMVLKSDLRLILSTLNSTKLEVTEVAAEIAAERRRQIEVEGWSPEHDDKHNEGEIATAAACYASPLPAYRQSGFRLGYISLWPWDLCWWKPKDRRRDLIRAGALILAEIERLDRQAALAKPDQGEG